MAIMGSLIGRCSRPTVTCLRLHAWNRRKWRLFYCCSVHYLLQLKLRAEIPAAQCDVDAGTWWCGQSTIDERRCKSQRWLDRGSAARCKVHDDSDEIYILIFKIEKFNISRWQFQAISQWFAAERIVAQTTFNLPTVGWKRDFAFATTLFSAADTRDTSSSSKSGTCTDDIVMNFFRADE